MSEGSFHGDNPFQRNTTESEPQPRILSRFVYDKERFGDAPEDVPDSEKHQECETSVGKIFATCDYGGPGSKYDDENQDSFVCGQAEDGSAFIAVIDGAGGSGGGLEASTLANTDLSQTLVKGMLPLEALVSASKKIGKKNDELKAQAEARGGHFNESRSAIYATGVAAVIGKDGKVRLASSGDSKIATIRGGKILAEGTTRMQNVATNSIEGGHCEPQDYFNHRWKSTITGGLGVGEESPEGKEFQGKHGDRIILASDGLWDIVSEYEVTELSNKHASAKEFQAALFDLAYARNNATEPYKIQYNQDIFVEMDASPGRKRGDNITIVVTQIDLIDQEKSREPARREQIYTVTTRQDGRMISFQIQIVAVDREKITFFDLTKPGVLQKNPVSWWEGVIASRETSLEQFVAPEPKSGDRYHFTGTQKDGQLYNFELTVERVDGTIVHCIGKTGNRFTRSRKFWEDLFATPGATATKL